MPEPSAAIFGEGRDWGDVYTYALSYMQKQYATAAPHIKQDIPDAVGEAIALAMEQWVTWNGSVLPDDPDTTLAGAKRYVCLEAKRWLMAGGNTPPEEVPAGLLNGHDEPLLEAASRAVEELEEDEREWESWARDLLEGKSLRETADDEGTHFTSVAERRERGIKRVTPMLRRVGVLT